MNSDPRRNCADCDASLDRRRFIQAAAGVALAGVAAPALLSGRTASAAPSAKSAAETTVGRFYASLSAEQRPILVFPFEHELRQKINANWHVTKPKIGDDFYTDGQRQLIHEILRGITSEEGYERLLLQTESDSGGIDDYSVAVFGSPDAGLFEWEITGRHLTLRADGDSVAKAAFGGPIIYGHGEESPKKNLFHYQTKQVNEVFRTLDAKQAARALVSAAAKESDVALRGANGPFPGIPIGELSADQKQLVEATLKLLLAPHRREDVDEVFEILKGSGGLEKLHLAFYQEGDLQDDKVWDIWRVEGPSFVWHFRGAPHVHAYINIGLMA